MTLSKNWENDPATTTPLSAEAMEDLESRINSEVAVVAALAPSAGQKQALAGTSGTPGTGNKFLTDADPRNTDDRDPLSHAASHAVGGSDPLSAQQGSWQTVALTGITGSLSYFKDSLGIVHFRGDLLAITGSPPADGATICTLPAGYRPGQTIWLPVYGKHSVGELGIRTIAITSAGVVTNASGGTWTASVSCSFGACHFRAEN